jgi:hypothetical protein
LPKKTVESIVEQQQHYLIALKANQPTLYRTLAALHQAGNPLTLAETVDTSHNRTVHRRVSVYAAPPTLQQQWAGLKTLIWVERWGVREQKPFHEQVGYISDLALTAAEFLPHIQQHWSIENQLHWVRDVTFEEDHARPGGNAPVMWAILNCFLLNIVRQLGCRTIPQGVRILANQVKRVFEFLTQGFSPPK